MANILETRDLLITHLYNNWIATDIAWPNKIYTSTSDTPFIKPFFSGGKGFDLEIGKDGADLGIFTFFIDIFTPLDSGDRTGLEYGEQLRTLFYDFDENDINLEAPAIIALGENSGFYQTRFSIPVKIIYYP